MQLALIDICELMLINLVHLNFRKINRNKKALNICNNYSNTCRIAANKIM